MKGLWFVVLVCILVLPNTTDLGNSATTSTSSDVTTQHFSSNILVSTSNNLPQHVEPTLAINSNNQLLVGWKNAQTSTGGGISVSFSKSIDNGQNWSTPITMPSLHPNSTWTQSDPWLVYFNNTIYYSYLDYQLSSNSSQVVLAKSTDNGKNWTDTQASHAQYFSDKETFIISPTGIIYLVYDDINLQGGFASVKLAKSTDNGNSFRYVSTVNKPGESIIAPYSALSANNTLFVTWTRYLIDNYQGQIYYDHSSNGGSNFITNTPLNSKSFVPQGINSYLNDKTTIPVIKFDSKDRLYILYAQYENSSEMKIYLQYSDDLGVHWSNKIPIDQTNNTNQWEPDMAIDSQNNLHIAWLEMFNNQYRPYYREISFSGSNRSTMTMSPIIPVATAYTTGNFIRPGDYLTIRVDSKDISHVVWTDGRSGSLNIYYAYLINSATKSSNGFTVIPVFTVLALVLIIKKIKTKHD